jgi:hypothetical protein
LRNYSSRSVAPEIRTSPDEAQREAETRQREWGKENAPSAVRRKLNARAMQQALKDSLIAIMERWRQDTPMAAFLAQIEAAV